MTNLLLYQRIAQQLAEDIRRGVYQPGERVPSVRKMSSQLNVSHATVLQAYANLEDQGLIRARPQSGYYVHQTPALTAPTPDIARVERPGLVTRASIIQQVLVESRREGVFPLGAAVPSVDYLPVRALHQQLAKVTRFHSPRAFSYMFSPGFEPLRRQVAIRMRDAGVVVDPSEVVITHGCVDALQMSLRVLTRPGDLDRRRIANLLRSAATGRPAGSESDRDPQRSGHRHVASRRCNWRLTDGRSRRWC